MNAARDGQRRGAGLVSGFADGLLAGTNRLYEEGVFKRHGSKDGKALFCMGEWPGWQATGKA